MLLDGLVSQFVPTTFQLCDFFLKFDQLKSARAIRLLHFSHCLFSQLLEREVVSYEKDESDGKDRRIIHKMKNNAESGCLGVRNIEKRQGGNYRDLERT